MPPSLQEKISEGKTDSARVPRTCDIELKKDLVGLVVPGDVVEVAGIIKALNADGGALAGDTGSSNC